LKSVAGPKGPGHRSVWYARRSSFDARKPNRPDSQPASLDDLETQGESDRRYRKRPSKMFRDLLRWEQHKIKEVMTLLRAEQREIQSHGKFDPLTVELIMNEDSSLADEQGEVLVHQGEVLRDPKLRPFYIHPLLNPNRILQAEFNFTDPKPA
jgi:hypothetical protein